MPSVQKSRSVETGTTADAMSNWGVEESEVTTSPVPKGANGRTMERLYTKMTEMLQYPVALLTHTKIMASGSSSVTAVIL